MAAAIVAPQPSGFARSASVAASARHLALRGGCLKTGWMQGADDREALEVG
ncbi:MAG: hypothetical protein ACRDQI_06325 [Pseudonocardiaceae bacterium]